MQSRVWLIPLIDAVRRAPDAAPAPPLGAGEAAFDAWLEAEFARRGYDRGLLADAFAALGVPEGGALAEPSFAAWGLVNHTAHRLQLALAARGGPRGPIADHAALLGAVARSLDLPRALDRARRLADFERVDDRRFVKAANALAAELGDGLRRRALAPDHPLHGHPFHQLLRLVEARRFARIARARALGGGHADPAALARVDGLARGTLHQAISAAIALAVADGIVDPPESALIDALMRAARFGDAERAMHRAEYADPPSAEAVAAGLTEPSDRRFVLRLLCLAAHVNGRYHHSERAFVERLAAAAGEDPAALDAYEAAALAAYEARPDLVERLSLGRAVGRMRRTLTGRVERLVRENSRRLWTEVRETGTLMHLLVEARRRPLTPDEEAAVRAQLIDICKAVPALALFAVPGGTILLPLVLRHLPIDLRPSSFADEALPAADPPEP